MMVFYPNASEQENLCNVSKPLARRNPRFLHGVIPNLGGFFCQQQKKDASTKRREKLRGKRIVGDCRGWSSTYGKRQHRCQIPLLYWKKNLAHSTTCAKRALHMRKRVEMAKENQAACKASLFTEITYFLSSFDLAPKIFIKGQNK